jgi:hypothetical protein
MQKPDIRPYSKKELAELYDMTTHCFTTMISSFIKDIGKRNGWYYNVNQVRIIFFKCGYPNHLLDDEFRPSDYRNSA